MRIYPVPLEYRLAVHAVLLEAVFPLIRQQYFSAQAAGPNDTINQLLHEVECRLAGKAVEVNAFVSSGQTQRRQSRRQTYEKTFQIGPLQRPIEQ